VEESPIRRTRWNLFQIELGRIRDSEDDLERIEGVADLSTPLRAVFWRGYRGYDIRALEYGHSRWGQTLWGAYSGARIRADGAKWSFGREVAIDHAMTEAELTAFGVWIPPSGEGEPAWLDIPWPDLAWSDLGEGSRSKLMLLGMPIGTAWAVFRDVDGEVIGYRRARINQRVDVQSGGPYAFGGLRYAPAVGATMILLEALTDFGEGHGATAASVAFILAAEPIETLPPGTLWLGPGELAGSPIEVASTPVSIPFGRTVRERVRALLRF